MINTSFARFFLSVIGWVFVVRWVNTGQRILLAIGLFFLIISIGLFAKMANRQQ